MNYSEPTRHSLILRIRDTENQAAWQEFVEIYKPLIQRIAVKLGMQPADAVDATQEVLLHLTNVVDQWNSQNGAGSFRGWLYRVSRNVMIRWMRGHDLNAIGSGHSDVHSLIEDEASFDPQEIEVVDIEYQRQIFAQAAQNIRPHFQNKTWQAFWLTVVEQKPVVEVGRQIEMSTGAIYVSRSRVMNRLRQEAKRLVDDQWDSLTRTGFFAANKQSSQKRKLP
jgi:RNA polymerase sigma-70 factor (ECF subfamily)